MQKKKRAKVRFFLNEIRSRRQAVNRKFIYVSQIIRSVNLKKCWYDMSIRRN